MSWQFPLTDIASSMGEIPKCKKHAILEDDYGYIWIIMKNIQTMLTTNHAYDKTIKSIQYNNPRSQI